MVTPCNMTYITPIYTSLHFVTQPKYSKCHIRLVLPFTLHYTVRDSVRQCKLAIMSVKMVTPCNMTYITLIYTSLHFVTQPKHFQMSHKTGVAIYTTLHCERQCKTM